MFFVSDVRAALLPFCSCCAGYTVLTLCLCFRGK